MSYSIGSGCRATGTPHHAHTFTRSERQTAQLSAPRCDSCAPVAVLRLRQDPPARPCPAVQAERRQRYGTVQGLREKQDFFAGVSWKSAGATPEVEEALQTLGIQKPSHVQAESYAALLSGAKHVVVADHAGSGKTLAYLLPLVQSMHREERALKAANGGERVNVTKPFEPRVVVVCPTEELCSQVVMICRALSKVIPFRSASFTGGHKMATHRSMLKEGVDIAVCTPGRLAQLMEAGNLKLQDCRGLVLDEVDVLLGDQGDFAAEVEALAKFTGDATRVILVTATLPEPTFMKLKYTFPGLVAAIGPNLHRTATGITETLVDCSGGTDMSQQGGTNRKLAALLAVMQRSPVPRTIVFCNKIETCRDVENFLIRQDRRGTTIVALAYHGAIDDRRRTDNLKSFLRPPQPDEPNRVLICTDRASRGIDSAYTEHVVLFDFPRDPSEYVRRVGRTARGALGRGTVSVLVMGRQVKLAREIIERNEKGLPVHTVPSAAAFSEDGATTSDRWLQ